MHAPAIGEDDLVLVLRRCPGDDAFRPAGHDLDAVAHEGRADRVRVARVVALVELLMRVDEGHAHAEAGVDLGQLDARRPGAQDDEAARQVAR